MWNSLIFTTLCKIKPVTHWKFTVCVYSIQRVPAEAVLDRASWPWKLCQGRDKQLSVWTPQPWVHWSSNGLVKPQETATSWESRAGKARLSTSHLHGPQHYSADSKLLKELFYRCHITGTRLTCHILSKSVRKQLCESLVWRAREGEQKRWVAQLLTPALLLFFHIWPVFKIVF